MEQHEGGVAEGPYQAERVDVLVREHLELEVQATPGHLAQAALPARVQHQVGDRGVAPGRVAMPVQLLADAPHGGVSQLAV